MTLSALGIFSAAGAGGVAVAGDYELISTTILGTSTASVTFSSLGDYSSTYKHLQIRAVAKYDSAFDNLLMRFNSDTGNNYSHHRLIGNGSTVSSIATANTSSLFPGLASSTTSGIYSPTVIDILDPYSTTKNTTIRALYGDSENPTVRLASGAWYNTSAISSILIYSQSSFNFVAGSRFSLYGIKG